MSHVRSPSYQDVRPNRSRDSLTEARAFEALERLHRTQAEWATLKAQRDRLEYMIGAAEAAAALYSNESSVEKRKWEARQSASYLQAVEQHFAVSERFFALDAERAALRLTIELFISLPGDRK